MQEKPKFVIVADAPTPYRLHFHRRIANELTEVQLLSVFTHRQSNAPWQLELPAEINPVQFGERGSYGRSVLSSIPREWSKGGRIIRYLKEIGPAAVLVNGYNDAGRVRIMRW